MAGDYSDYERKLIEAVHEHGWFCLCVGAGDETPGFAYSIGFAETLQAPEFIVFGLDFSLMHNMLWTVFRQVRDGSDARDGGRWTDLISGFDCVSRAVHPSNIVPEYLNSAIWYHEETGANAPLRAMQIVWPGAEDGYFPWEPRCAQIVRDHQPPLWLPNPHLH
jgi:uncharacterized protein DUF4262